jgi:hypothetical protein
MPREMSRMQEKGGLSSIYALRNVYNAGEGGVSSMQREMSKMRWKLEYALCNEKCLECRKMVD